MTREDAARKVRALRKTAAEGSGATAPERATANRMADRLAAEHGLDQPAPAARRDAPTVTVTVNASDFDLSSMGLNRQQWEASVAAALRGKSREELLRRKCEMFRDILNGME